MTYNWYFIFNSDEFLATGLPSRTYSLILRTVGPKDILVTQGNKLGMTYEGVFLPLEINDDNPFEFEDLAAYMDDAGDVWLGIKVEGE